MKTKSLWLLFLIAFFIACDSENGQTDLPDDEVVQEPNEDEDEDDVVEETDDTPPILSISDLGESIETYVDVVATISDESSVETKIVVNDEEIFTTSELQFNYQLNPYVIPVGIAQIQVISEDELGNVTTKDFQVEIKHFLMEYNMGADEEERYAANWVFFNDGEGNLLKSQKVVAGSTKIFTDEIVPDNFVLYTIAKYEILGSEGQNRALRNTTYRFNLGETRNAFEYYPTYKLENYVDVEINLEEDNVEGYQLYGGSGSEYDMYLTGGGSFLERVGFKYDSPDYIYLRTDILGGQPALFDGKKENYRYYRFAPELSMPVITIDESDLMPANEYIVLQVPDHMPGSFVFNRYGFENETDLASNTNHEIFVVHEPNDTYRDYVDLPVVEGLGLYSNTINYFMDGKGLYAYLFGNNLDISMPNWELNFGIENNKIFIEENNDLDYYMVQFRNNDTSDFNKLRYWTWNYRAFGTGDNNIPMPVLEMPEDLVSEINDAHYVNNANLTLERTYAVEFDNLESYNESVEWLGLNKIPLTTAQKGYKEMIFYYNPPPIVGKRKENLLNIEPQKQE